MRTRGLCAAGTAAALCIAWLGTPCAADDARNDLARANALAQEGVAKINSGKYAESEGALREALAIRERLLLADDPEIAATLNDLGASLFYQTRFKEAESLYQRAVAIFRGYPGRRPDLARTLANLGALYGEQLRFQEAGAIYTELFDMMLDPAAVRESTAASVYNDYGLMLKETGDWNGAEAALTRAAGMREREHDPRVAEVWSSLGDLCYTRGDFERAEALFRKSVASCETAGKDDNRCGSPLNGLALTLMRHGLDDDARVLLERALHIFERIYGPNHPKLAAVLNNLGNLAEHKHDYKRAEANLSRAMSIWIASFGPDYPEVASANSNLGTLFMHRRQWPKAESYYQKALSIDEKGNDRRTVGRDLNNLGVLYSGMKRHADAEDCFNRAVHVYEESDGPASPAVASVVLNLANQYAITKRYTDAIPLYKRALEICERHPSDIDAAAAAFDTYAVLARRNDDYADAEKAAAFATRLRVRSAITRERLR